MLWDGWKLGPAGGVRWKVKGSPKTVSFVLSAPNGIEFNPIAVEKFHEKKDKNVNLWWHYGKTQRIIKVSWIHPLWTMNTCTKYYGNPSRSCWDIIVWTNPNAIPEQNCIYGAINTKEDFGRLPLQYWKSNFSFYTATNTSVRFLYCTVFHQTNKPQKETHLLSLPHHWSISPPCA